MSLLMLPAAYPFPSPNWPAHWVWTDGVGAGEGGGEGAGFEAAMFARRFTFRGGVVRVHVSADQRYRLYLDGQWLGEGPVALDLHDWGFDSYDLTPALREGEHTLTALVWHDRDTAPGRQMSTRPAFMLAAESPYTADLSTGASWRCRRLTSHGAVRPAEEVLLAGPSYTTSGLTPGDLVPDPMELEPPRVWESVTDHRAAIAVQPWRLTPRRIPMMRRDPDAVGTVEGGWPFPLVVPPHTQRRWRFARPTLTVAWPRLTVSGGAGSTLSMRYAEALLREPLDMFSKGHRGDEGAFPAFSPVDTLRPDGRAGVVFEPYHPRTWRYLELCVATGDEPVRIEALFAHATRYPMERTARFDAPAWMTELVEPGWRTLSLCAHETYIDSPYYEFMQYTTDTWLQMLVSFVTQGDDRLARSAVEAFHHGQRPEGWVPSRFPSRIPQLIPTLGLVSVSMLRDFLLWRGDAAFVKRHAGMVTRVLEAFAQHRDERGLIRALPNWSFVDWVAHRSWFNGSPPGWDRGGSYVISALYLLALQEATELFALLGESAMSQRFHAEAGSLRETLRREAWRAERGLFVDEAGGEALSVHMQVLAVLTGCVEGVTEPMSLLDRVLAEADAAQPTLYFLHFLFEALHRCGRGESIWPRLRLWHDALDRGLSTFPETPDPTRSDCHAWACHPLYHYFASLIGLRPTSPGCATMTLTPPPRRGLPERLGGALVTPHGLVEVALSALGEGWRVSVRAPAAVRVEARGLYAGAVDYSTLG